jgi:hypothetical protein
MISITVVGDQFEETSVAAGRGVHRQSVVATQLIQLTVRMQTHFHSATIVKNPNNVEVRLLTELFS